MAEDKESPDGTGPLVEPTSPTPNGRKMLPSGFATIRDLATFAIGLVILAHEIFMSEQVEPYVLAVGLAMTGLPVVLGADERRKSS